MVGVLVSVPVSVHVPVSPDVPVSRFRGFAKQDLTPKPPADDLLGQAEPELCDRRTARQFRQGGDTLTIVPRHLTHV